MPTIQDVQNRTPKKFVEEQAAQFRSAGVIAIILATCGLVAALVFGILMVRPKTTELTAQVLSGDELTLPPQVGRLVGHYTYDGKEVEHLWKIRVNFANTGDTTLVGTGPACNVLYRALLFEFPSATRILDIETPDSDQLGACVTAYDENEFKIEFEQWRKGENLVTSFFVASDIHDEQPPALSAIERQIVDGEVRVQTLLGQEGLPRRSYLTTSPFPRPLAASTRVVGLAFVGFMIFVGGWFLTTPYKYIRRLRWRTRYLHQFEKYVSRSSEIDKDMKELYIRHPSLLEREHWSKFQGKRYPGDPITDAAWSTVAISVAGLAIIFFFALLATDLLPLF